MTRLLGLSWSNDDFKKVGLYSQLGFGVFSVWNRFFRYQLEKESIEDVVNTGKKSNKSGKVDNEEDVYPYQKRDLEKVILYIFIFLFLIY